MPRTGEDEHIVQILDPLDPVQLRRGEPQEVRQMPLALRNVFVLPPLARVHDTDPIALLRSVVEARHEVSPFLVDAVFISGPPRLARDT